MGSPRTEVTENSLHHQSEKLWFICLADWPRIVSLYQMASTETPSPLPQIPGPTLEPFRGTASAEIEFLEFLGDEKDVVSKVWKVRIDDQIYALKIVSQRGMISRKATPPPLEYASYNG